MVVRAWLLLLLVPLAGCLADDGPDLNDVARDVEAAAEDFLVADHDHADASLHASSLNFERVGYTNGFDNSGSADAIPAGMTYNELAVHGDYAYLVRATPEPGLSVPTPVCGRVPSPLDGGIPVQHGGFSIINVADPTDPLVVGTYEALPGADIEVSRDGELVFFSTQRNCPNQIAGVLQADNDPSDVLPRGIHIVDVRDPRAPELVFMQPLPVNGPHTITYGEVANQELLFVSTYDLYDDPAGNPAVVAATQRVYIFELLRDPASLTDQVSLRLANVFFLTDRGNQGQLVFPHDAIHQTHPTGRELLYVAYWDKGVQIVDITDLNGPLPVVDAFTDFSPSSHNAIHLARPFEEPINGQHITVAQPELISADETGQITFLDTTLPDDIRKVGTWTLPGELTVHTFDFSPHNFVLRDAKVFLAHNHAGIWVIDAQDVEQPRSTGYFLDVEPRMDSPIHQPWFWGTQWATTGELLAVDQSSGLYVLRYTGP